MFPHTRVPFWYRFSEPQPNGCGKVRLLSSLLGSGFDYDPLGLFRPGENFSQEPGSPERRPKGFVQEVSPKRTNRVTHSLSS